MPPDRPASVPLDALWVEDQGIWELAGRGVDGCRTGPARLFRADGTLYKEMGYGADVLTGPFTVFHPDGTAASRGVYVDGGLDGEVVSFSSDAPTPERLRACCVPAGAWQMRARYTGGEFQGEQFFDREGRSLLSDGRLRPNRPPGVPEGAGYDEFSGRWTRQEPTPDGQSTLHTYWDGEGLLDERSTYVGHEKRQSQFFDGDAELRGLVQFSADRKRHGEFWRRFREPAESGYGDENLIEERGFFDHERPVGMWTLHDGTGAVRVTLDRGRAFIGADVETSPAFADDDLPAAHFWALSQTLRAQGQAAEGLVAGARALGRTSVQDQDESLAGFARLCAASCARVTVARGDELAADLDAADDDPMGRALWAWMQGADPALVLRTLASAIQGRVYAARDLVQAAVLLAPDRVMTYLTRALIRIEMGDEAGARADADRVKIQSPESAAFVTGFADLVFPVWRFEPLSSFPPEGPDDQMPSEPAQPLVQIRRMIQVYATRLRLLRTAVLRWLPGPARPAWLPPDYADLLPEGPVELRRFSGTIVDDSDEGPETSTVQIDETLVTAGATVATLMQAARAQHLALTYLCWSVGLDHVALPDVALPDVALPEPVCVPPLFASATGMALTRYSRVDDVLTTGGLRALTRGVPGFVWEGQQVDDLPRPFAQIAAEECFEVRAVFLWLIFAENLSPFQSDLRQR